MESKVEVLGTKKKKRRTASGQQPGQNNGEPGATTLQAVDLSVTPSHIDMSLCLARIWGGGNGGQCGKAPLEGERVCKRHKTQQAHGLVTGEVPPQKLDQFQKAAATNT